MPFQKAVKRDAKLRLALAGPTGSGKTMTALKIGTRLAEVDGLTIGVIDTEHGSASKYADQFDFLTLELTDFDPRKYVAAMKDAAAAGIGVLIIDSLSHAYAGKGGLLEIVDNAAKRYGGNSYAGWKDATPLQNALIEAILSYPGHLIGTMRSKQDYVQDRDEKGKITIRKVGMNPIQRDGIEYEFDIYGDLTLDNTLIVQKTRCPALAGLSISKPGADLADTIRDWLKGDAPAAEPANVTPFRAAVADEPPPLTQDGFKEWVALQGITGPDVQRALGNRTTRQYREETGASWDDVKAAVQGAIFPAPPAEVAP